MTALGFAEARQCVLETVGASLDPFSSENVSSESALGRVLASPVLADRDYPPVARSLRDGFALRASNLPGPLQIIGEVRAGEMFPRPLQPGETIEIMTGAPVPEGADAVLMVEHAQRSGDRLTSGRPVAAGEFIVLQGSQCRRGEAVLQSGQPLDYSSLAALATFGVLHVPVYRRPRVAILATGDEVIEAAETPEPFQVRNSNSPTLAAQIGLAGGCPVTLPIARDQLSSLRDLIAQGLASDLLLLAGGVSAGKYDLVEDVLAEFGAEIFFDRVSIQPGQPLVFGRARGRFFFGLPGNPASVMVTFRLFAQAALHLLAGRSESGLPIFAVPLAEAFRHKTGLTRFLPAQLSSNGQSVRPVRWQDSSDIAAMARANAYLVVPADRASWEAGESIGVLLK